jgi:S1/P1 Nuclease
MNSKFKLAALAFAVLVIVSNKADAWHAAGHMMTAAVAWEQMTDTARKRASELLKLNPDYDSWVKGIPDADKDKTAFMRAASWPDDIKNKLTHPASIDDGEEPTDPNAAANLGYSDKLMHKYWHYIDLPFTTDKTKLIDPKNPNAETQIKAFRDTIAAAGGSDDVKSYDVAWLIHMVGDVHQPLHATSRYSKLHPKGDVGGNLVMIKCTPKCDKNLHSFWDGLVDANRTTPAMIAAAAKLKKATGPAVSKTDPHVWITESFAIAKNSVYRPPIGTADKTFTITSAYKKAAMTIGRQRIALGGARLAKLFNDAFK